MFMYICTTTNIVSSELVTIVCVNYMGGVVRITILADRRGRGK